MSLVFHVELGSANIPKVGLNRGTLSLLYARGVFYFLVLKDNFGLEVFFLKNGVCIMLLSSKFWAMVEHFMEVIGAETGFPVLIYDEKGYIVRATDKSRIGDLHAGGEKIMKGLVDVYATTSEETALNPMVREGYSCPIVIDGKRIAGIGITGNLNQAKPLAKIAIKLIDSWIADRKHQEQLEHSERKYRSIFDHSAQGIFQSTLDGQLITANAVLAKLYGYESPESLLAEITDIAHGLCANPEDHKRLIAQLHDKGSVTGFLTQNRRRDGQIIDVSMNAHFVSDPETGGRLIEGIVEDITEKNQILQAIKLSEEKYFKAFNNNPGWVVLSAMETGRYIEVNETFLRTMGYTREEIIGRTSLETRTWENPDDRQIILDRIEDKGYVRNYEVRRLTKSGETLIMLFSAEVIEISGEACLLSVSQDISARKQAEEHLHMSEDNLRITLDSIGDAVITTDTDGVITRMNPMAERLTGWAATEAVGRPLPEVFHIINAHTRVPESNPAQKVLQKGKIIGLANHTILVNKAGNEYQIADSGAPIRGADGKIVGVVLVFRDVTEAYAQAKKIRDSERQLKNISTNLPGVVFEFHATGDHVYSIRFVSEKAVEFYGQDASAGRFFEEFYAHIPDDEKTGFMESIREAVDHVRPWYYEGRIIRAGGERMWFSGSSSPVKEDDGIIFYGVLMDITERKQWQQTLAASESRYRDLFNEAPVMYVITESRQNEPYIQDVNNMFTEVLGYSRREVLNTPLKKYYTEDSIRELMDRGGYQRALNGTFSIEERTLIDCDGKAVPTQLHALPAINCEGRTVGTRAMFVDISDRKRAEEQAKQLETALAQSQKMEAIGTLAGGIAHDFNNILSAVIGYAELSLNEAQKETRQHRNLEQIIIAGMRARDLVRQILTFSRQNERELRPLQIEPLIKEALKLLRSSLPSTIEISRQIDSHLDNVMADPIQIHQIIMNLCTNAAQAMDDNGGQLIIRMSEVNLTRQDIHLYPGLKPGIYVKLSVQDTGKGIPEEIIDKIFLPYFSTKEKGEGTGLGLSVVHGIVRSYGGTIHVDSKPGCGATFNVYIPAIKRAALIEKRDEAALPTGSERILFVDDEPALVKLGQQILEMLGYQVTTCNGSLEALEVFNRSPDDVDLVISDMTMPKMTGDKLAVELLKMRPDLPIILCTGFSKKISKQKAAEIGIKKIVTKPFAASKMANIVKTVLDEAGRKN